ncbi:hypothetical protein D2Q93_10170 [Alicyclobacillaceae bacterium I2511]|nr:hypothetical protein D2Q93_10170 [Alicyclobacillaceae bacterium I2511]
MMSSLLRMQLPLTKITRPPVRMQRVFRPVLMQKLAQACASPLTMVHAPAGYGKTSLVADWAQSMSTSVAWVSLDPGDNDPHRFWISVLGALAQVNEDLIKDPLEFVSAVSGADAESFTLSLETQLALLSADIWLVLDDYHQIHLELIHHQLEHLFQYVPERFHLILISRNRPPLRIGRLRTEEKVQELRIEDLRCTLDEVGQFCREVFDWHPDVDSLARIHSKTEGWMVGMHLLGMAVNEGCECTKLLESVEGSHTFVTEYLTEEVWTNQPSEIKEFLLKTCVLEQFNAALCQAITGLSDTPKQLSRLYAENAFLVALNPEKTWFRYHHLFADVLRTRLADTHPDWVISLHRKAADWLMEHGMTHQAIHHILQAADETRAVTWIYELAPNLLHRGERSTLHHWLNQLTSQTLQANPKAALLSAWIYSLQNQHNLAERKLALVRQVLLKMDEQGESDSTLWGEYHTLRGYLAMIGQDAQQAIHHMQQSAIHNPGHSQFFQAGLELNSGEPYFLRTALGQRGYLRRLQNLYTTLRDLLKHSGLGVLGYGSITLGELYYEWNDVTQLTYFIPRALELGFRSKDLGILVPAHLLHARVLRAEGRRAEMWEAISQAEQLLRDSKNHSRWTIVLEAFKTRKWLEEANLAGAEQWVADRRVAHYTTIQETNEFELITLARVWLAQEKQTEVLHLLTRLLRFAQATDRLGSKIEVLCLQALAFQQAKNFPAALANLTEALTLGMPEGYRRTFLDEGPVLQELLQTWQMTHKENPKAQATTETEPLFPNLPSYTKALLGETWFSLPQPKRLQNPQAILPEPLTAREMETLDLMASGLKNAEIAQRLQVSLGTVKGYTHHIFGKLAVRNRTEAIAQARKLGLL